MTYSNQDQIGGALAKLLVNFLAPISSDCPTESRRRRLGIRRRHYLKKVITVIAIVAKAIANVATAIQNVDPRQIPIRAKIV